MPVTKRRSTKRPSGKKVHSSSRRAALGRRKGILEVTALGVAADQLAQVMPTQVALFTPTPKYTRREPLVWGFTPLVLPPSNLPVEEASSIADPVSAVRLLRRPLVSPRTSFWLGVGFGTLVVGVLLIVAWQLFRVETVEAVVVGLTRSH